MVAIAVKAVTSKLAKTTFLASVPKLSPDVALGLAGSLLQSREISSIDKSFHDVFRSLFNTLPAKAKKEARREIARAKAAADSAPELESTEP